MNRKNDAQENDRPITEMMEHDRIMDAIAIIAMFTRAKTPFIIHKVNEHVLTHVTNVMKHIYGYQAARSNQLVDYHNGIVGCGLDAPGYKPA